jgi:nucleotide-binding universal stress UspA family protein
MFGIKVAHIAVEHTKRLLGGIDMSARIMVAIHNGSPGVGTMELAGNWAQRLGGSVVGVGVVDESVWAPAPVAPATSAGLGGVAVAEDDARRTRAEEYVRYSLQQLEEHCRKSGVEHRQMKVTGVPEEEILLEAQRNDVILLGKQSTPDPGLGVPARTILTNILRHSPCPVVAAPDGAGDGRGVLVAYDGSLQAARALRALVVSGLAGLGEVKVLSLDKKSKQAAGEHAARAVDYLALHGIQAESQAESSNEPTERFILDAAARQGVELIAMGAYGRSRLAEFFLGSVTTHVIDESPLPVFLAH